MTIWITTNGRPSNGAKALAQQPGFERSITGNRVKPDDVIINWGSTKNWDWPEATRLNHPHAVEVATNKLEAFKQMCWPQHHVNTVEWTESPEIAKQWQTKGYTIVARTKLTGHSGDGIIIVKEDEDIPDAPLYTKYIFKEKEYRVHVVGDKVIDTQRKIKDPSREVISWKVRSHQNGFIFARNNIVPDHSRDDAAVAAVKSLGLHFGAVDIIQERIYQKDIYYVLEINTAPGLEGQTVERYAQAFRDWAEANG